MDNADIEYLYFLAEKARKNTQDNFCHTWLDHLKDHLMYLAMLKERPHEAVQNESVSHIQ